MSECLFSRFSWPFQQTVRSYRMKIIFSHEGSQIVNMSHIQKVHEVKILKFLSFVISLALQSNMDLGLPHNPPPALSILGLHSPTSDVHPEVLLLFCYPAFSWSFWFFPAVDIFIQYLFRHTVIICFAWPSMDSIL